MHHRGFPRHRAALAALTLVVVFIVIGGRSATAQTVIQIDGAVNVGYSAITGTNVTVDPADPQARGTNRAFTDVRPSFAIQSGSPRLAWRAGYVFGASLSLDGANTFSYSNQADLSLTAQLTPRSAMTVRGGFTQGGTAFQLSQRTADTSQPTIRAPGDPATVTATLGESLKWQASPGFNLAQDITASMSAPQNELGSPNFAFAGTLSLSRVFATDSFGAEFRPSFSVLRPLTAQGAHFVTITSALQGRWSHDFSWRWNGQVSAGVEQVVTLAGSYPLSIVPRGSVSAKYLAGNAVASLAVDHGATTNLETGTVSMTDQVTVHGLVSFDALRPRVLGVSAGFLHNQPLGEAAAAVAAGTGNAVQGDVGLAWGVWDSVLATARYSVAYQWGQAGGLEPSLAHVFLVGVTARYSTGRYSAPIPPPPGGGSPE